MAICRVSIQAMRVGHGLGLVEPDMHEASGWAYSTLFRTYIEP